jgi:hypothetical protein
LSLYTVAGLASSAAVGLILGVIGSIVPDWPLMAALVPIGVALLVMIREFEIVSIPLVQWRRQTSDIWGKTLPRSLAAVLWGLDLGLVFTTFLTFSGAWLLTSMAIFGRDPLGAALLFSAYWLGRAATVWFAASVMARRQVNALGLIELVGRRRDVFRRIHAGTAAWAAAALGVAAATHLAM